MSEAERLYQELKSGSQDSFQSLSELLLGIEDTAFLKQLSGSLLLKASADNPAFSAINLTEWLFEIDGEADPSQLKSRILDHLKRLLLLPPKDTNTSSMIDQITTYVEQNLSNSGLTLKFISEQVLL